MEKSTIQPLADRVIILPDPPKAILSEKLDLVSPDMFQVALPMGTVIACGPGLPNQPISVKIGDHVLHGKSATEIEDKGRKVLIMNEGNIYAIMD